MGAINVLQVKTMALSLMGDNVSDMSEAGAMLMDMLTEIQSVTDEIEKAKAENVKYREVLEKIYEEVRKSDQSVAGGVCMILEEELEW